MKKAIIGLSGIVLVAFVVIMVASAQNSTREARKASTEMSKNGAKCPYASTCRHMKETNTTETKTCDPSKCKEMGCDTAKCKEAKCDPATCKAKCAKADGKKCEAAANKNCTKK